uniref:DUF1618 domain-containing protein n=1 Tax=Leersia perrieri TaxID=77586 RepID=A0A0D9Y005_9ORYZ
MSTTTGNQRRRRRRREKSGSSSSSPPEWILVNKGVYTGNHRGNSTTAVGEGRENLTIQVSLSPAQPPRPSNVLLCCPGVRYPRESEVLFTADDLLLLRVPVAAGPAPSCIGFDECDYLIYRAAGGDGWPSLTLLPNPDPNFHDGDVGILPRAGGEYTVAALVANPTENEYTLTRFDSAAGEGWTTKTDGHAASAAAGENPHQRAATQPPHDHHDHHNRRRIRAMGWVDLWTGILVYDLLRPGSGDSLRHLPLPLPMHAITCNHRMGDELALPCPRSLRGIVSFTKRDTGKPCLRLAGLAGERLPYSDIETQLPAFAVHDWTVTTWTNTHMAGYYEDWHEEFTVRGSDVRISDAVRSQLIASGLLQRKPSRDGETVVEELALHHLYVSQPTPSLNNGEEDDHVVYLMASPKCLHPKAWALALDMRNSTLLNVAEFGTETGPSLGVTYRPSTIQVHESADSSSDWENLRLLLIICNQDGTTGLFGD